MNTEVNTDNVALTQRLSSKTNYTYGVISCYYTAYYPIFSHFYLHDILYIGTNT